MTMSYHRERVRCLQILGLQEGVSEEDIKKAYKSGALRYHPDKNHSHDAKEKFQQLTAAYKYLTEGPSFLNDPRDDDDEDLLDIFVHIFPWLFQRGPHFGFPSHVFQRPNPGFYSPFFEYQQQPNQRYQQPPQQSSVRGGYQQPSHSGYQQPSHGGYQQPSHGGYQQSSRGGYQQPSHSGAQRPNLRQQKPAQQYYASDSDSDGNDDSYFTKHPPSQNFRAAKESDTSQHLRKTTTFTEASERHGQYFHDTSKSRGKKKNKAELSEARGSGWYKQKETTTSKPDLGDNQHKGNNADASQAAKKEQKDPSPVPNSKGLGNAGDIINNKLPEEPSKKSKKQILMEQKQREKEANEIREQLEQQEREKKEKMEKKRAVQEEKERKEKEAREEEERIRLEEESKWEEERRNQMEAEEQERKEQRELEEKKRKLMEEFDKDTFLDDTGDFKYTDPDMKNIIRRDDMNPLGDAHRGKPSTKLEAINGLNAEDLIKLQNLDFNEYKAKPQAKQPSQPSSAERFGPNSQPAKDEYAKNRYYQGRQGRFEQPKGQPQHPGNYQHNPNFKQHSFYQQQQNYYQNQRNIYQQQQQQPPPPRVSQQQLPPPRCSQQQHFAPHHSQSFQNQPRQNLRPPRPFHIGPRVFTRTARPNGGMKQDYPYYAPHFQNPQHQTAYPPPKFNNAYPPPGIPNYNL